jgi:hypothetical protein
MAFSTDLRAAARRHRDAADALFDEARTKAVAGYLYGIAAECAVKAMMEDVGMRPDRSNRDGDPFFKHFPELRTLLRDHGQGRLTKTLRNLIDNDQFMQYWDTKMRYAPGRDVQSDWIEKWREQAHQAVACIGT